MIKLCPCGSKKDYQECCQITHNSHSLVCSPEQLMRSRYSAHVLNNVEYVIQTYHPSCKAESQRSSITESVDLNWCQLEIIDSSKCCENEQGILQGFVEFIAYYREEDKLYTLHERSRFLYQNELWYYIDGTFIEKSIEGNRSNPVKIKRNDPCPCKSGKKFKKCCG